LLKQFSAQLENHNVLGLLNVYLSMKYVRQSMDLWMHFFLVERVKWKCREQISNHKFWSAESLAKSWHTDANSNSDAISTKENKWKIISMGRRRK
jgi:hypothetical protein